LGLSGLLAAVGVLAFFFSVISPYDDDVQQEFIQANKTKQLASVDHRSPDNGGNHTTSKVRYAIITSNGLIANPGTELRDIAENPEQSGWLLPGSGRDRAPPSQSLS
jgi:hypothetical protein